MWSHPGLRMRLLFAFLAISAFAVLAAVVAMYSFIHAGKALERISQDRVPATIASQQLSRQAERIVAIAPRWLSIDNSDAHDRLSRQIGAELDLLETQLEQLEALDVRPERLRLISNPVFLMRSNLAAVDTMVFNYLVLEERRTELLRELSFTDISARRLLAPGLLVLDAKIDEVRGALDAAGRTGEDQPRLDELAAPVIELAPLQAAELQVAAINNQLVKIANAQSAPDIDVLGFPLRRALSGLAQAIAQMTPELAPRMQLRLDEFRDLAEGENSLTRIRQAELAQRRLMHALIEDNAEISARLTDAVDRLVTLAERDIREANQEALAVQQTSTVIMVMVVILSLFCSAMIVWLYVGRNLIARLTGLNDSMVAIARGDLEAAIPTGGNDEISRMADALVVFRDTAVEVRESNLREIRTARQRLSDAIESIDEAFSLYDDDARLVLYNSRYRDLFAPIADTIDAGVPFTNILRRATEAGLFEVEDGDREGFIQHWLQQFRERRGAHLRRLADGRCLQVDESGTDEGFTVAIYSDISELVRKSRQLEEWNRDLEERVARQVDELHRVEQLKRYFPPQLTDVIVSDREADLLEDHRREITVIFCDLRGYTAFSSTTEPEEEMRVLREYHEVICPLIFDYGATLEHFAGDGVMAFLNDPITYDDHVARAVRMADAMRRGMHELLREWRRREIHMGFGIGLGTGYATLGRIGTRTQFHYAAIGSVANLAARLCDEALHDQILIPMRVRAEIESDFETERVGELELKGFPEAVTVYNVVGPKA